MPYSVFAKYYDLLMKDVDYAARADYIRRLFGRYGDVGGTVLDLCCGTGGITFALAALGYDMLGVDFSEEMLAQAAAKQPAGRPVPLICQDIRSLDLYGTVSAAVCALDGFNHLLKVADLQQAFSSVSLFLEPGGLLVFDLNSPRKFEQAFGENAYVYDESGVFCVWRNHYTPKSRVCRFDLTFFEPEGALYRRCGESFAERAYPTSRVKSCLSRAGLRLLAALDDLSLDGETEASERIVYVARKEPPEPASKIV